MVFVGGHRLLLTASVIDPSRDLLFSVTDPRTGRRAVLVLPRRDAASVLGQHAPELLLAPTQERVDELIGLLQCVSSIPPPANAPLRSTWRPSTDSFVYVNVDCMWGN